MRKGWKMFHPENAVERCFVPVCACVDRELEEKVLGK